MNSSVSSKSWYSATVWITPDFFGSPSWPPASTPSSTFQAADPTVFQPSRSLPLKIGAACRAAQRTTHLMFDSRRMTFVDWAILTKEDTMTSIAAVALALALQEKGVGYDDTPQLPDQKWKVHDST